MKTYLAYRFSAFGDVAMAAVVLREFVIQNPEIQIVIISRTNYSPLFQYHPNIHFHGVDLSKHRGILKLWKLAAELKKKYQPTGVFDLHNVLRTRILNTYFKLKNINVSILNKNRDERKQLISKSHSNKKAIHPMTENYAECFRKMGFELTLSNQLTHHNINKEGIGIAPFAQHKSKMLPLEKSFEIAKILAQHHPIFFFGGGNKETEILQQWALKIPNATSLAGKLNLKGELEKIASLKLMISMDSANMHLASLVGTRCISVWGATHYFAGFLGYGQAQKDVVEVEDLSCRPCSIFGKKKCFRGDYACLNELKIQTILDKIN